MPSDAEALGQELRKARETRGLTLEQAERQTRIRAKYLDALEQGHHYALPSAVQARGFLRNYARFLNLDGDMMVAWFDSAQGGRKRRRRQPVRQSNAEDPTLSSEGRGTMGRRPADPEALIRSAQPLLTVEEREQQKRRGNILGTLFISAVALVALAGLLILGGIGLQSLISQGNKPGVILSAAPVNTASTRPALAATSEVTATALRPTPLPIPATATLPPTNSAPVGGVAVSLQIVERTWLRVIVDGAVTYTGSVAPNTVLQYQGKQVQVRVANAAGVHVVVNGQDYGIMGNRGQIVEQTYTVGSTIPSNSPPATANSPGTFNVPDGQTTAQNVITSPGATFSFTLTTTGRPRVTASVLPTLPPSKTYTATPPNSATPTVTPTASITLTPSQTRMPSATPTPTLTLTPSMSSTPSMTPTPTNTLFFLPHDTSTPESGEIRPK